ncbi:MAG: hypothetical protein JNK65_05890 [Deltaproteobacteria bacterium]|nr:hypothetical protein [Deltaproteobacteria bacterium]
MSVEIRYTLGEEILKKVREMDPQVLRGLEIGLKQGAFFLEARIKRALSQSGRGGKVYKRGEKSHVASAPGQAPAVDSGRLLNSIRTDFKGINDVRIGSDVIYASFLEKGTSKMGSRPYLSRVINENPNAIEEIILKAIEKELQK